MNANVTISLDSCFILFFLKSYVEKQQQKKSEEEKHNYTDSDGGVKHSKQLVARFSLGTRLIYRRSSSTVI